MIGRAPEAAVAAIFALDQVTKRMVVGRFDLGESLAVVPGFFSLTYLRNRGGAFGVMAGLPEEIRVGFFVAFALATLAALLWMLRGTPADEKAQRAALVAVIGGAAGNLYDRIAYGEVVDFLDVYVGDWHWPAFNVADSFITCGVILLLVAAFRAPDPASAE